MTTETPLPFVLEFSWQQALQEELKKSYLLKLASFVEKEYALNSQAIYPPKDLIFNAFNQTPYANVKVVLVGQDPYHGASQAHGLCFSVPRGVKSPPSLQNIFKELQSDLMIPLPPHGCLLSWAQQGVLMLNATLTVKEGEPLSHHGKGWEQLTDAVIHQLMEREDPPIFVLWGKSAQDKCRFLRESGNESKHTVLTAAHPSPFSAHNGFFGCRHFSKINEILVQRGKSPIDWDIK